MADLTEKQMIDAWLGDQKEKLLHLAVEEYCVRYSKLAVDIDWYREAQKSIEFSASWQKEEARLHKIIEVMYQNKLSPLNIRMYFEMAQRGVNENGIVCDCCECAPCICEGDDRGEM